MKPDRLVTFAVTALFVALLGWRIARREPSSPLIDKPAPDFALPVMAGEGAAEGDRLRLSDFKGQVVVLDFFASWCIPCRISVPELSAAAQELAPRGVRFIGINGEPIRRELYASLWREWGFGYPIVQDAANQSLVAYGITSYPSVFVIDRTQKVRFAYNGAPSKALLLRKISSILE
jgi:cytochrome c biogenesis protein CcmG/thiol:disulfide interchange protein DsbE